MYKCLIQKEIGKYPQLEVKYIPEGYDGPVIEMKAAALNHRDLWITQGKYARIKLPVVLGSDGSGIYEGKRVLAQPGMNWPPGSPWQSKDYQIVGMPGDGTFAEKFAIPERYIHPMPAHLSFEEGAALPLAGLTGWRALVTKGSPKTGDKILINGIGGGVALTIFTFAKAMGLEIYVTSGDHQKIDKAIRLGAKGGVLYTNENYVDELIEMSGGIDIILDSAGGNGLGSLLNLCNPGARIVLYGGTLGQISLSPQKLFWKQISIHGTTMGSDQEFQEMLDFVTKHEVRPVIDSVYPLHQSELAFQRMQKGQQFGKIDFHIAD